MDASKTTKTTTTTTEYSSSTGTGTTTGSSIFGGGAGGGSTHSSSTHTSGGGGGGALSSAFSGLGHDLATGAHKAAQAVGLEEKPLGTKLKDDAKNIGDAVKMEGRKAGH